MHLRVIVLFFKAKTDGSRPQDVDQSLKLHGDAKANGEPPTQGSSDGAQEKERNPSKSPKHDDTPSNPETDSVTAETQNSGTAVGEIGITNSSSESKGSFKAVHDKGSKNSSEGKVNNGEESKDCTQEGTQTPNQVATVSNSLQFQTSPQSVKESSGSEHYAVDSSRGPQRGIQQFLFCAAADSNVFSDRGSDKLPWHPFVRFSSLGF